MSQLAEQARPAAARGRPARPQGLSDRVLDAIRARPGLGQALLLLPGTLFMGGLILVALAAVVVFSLWRSSGMVMRPAWGLHNYAQILSGENLQSLLFTVRETLILLLLVWIVSYPIAYFLARMVRSQALQIAILLLCIIPFWTSYTVRLIAWIPMLGRNGLINLTLMSLGIVSEPVDIFLYSEPAMLFVMVLTYSLFCIGPLFFAISRVPQELLDAADNLGADPLRAFLFVILPLSLPGLMAGSIFVVALAIGEFAAPSVIGGGKFPFLGTSIVQASNLLQWPLASAYSVVLVATTLLLVSVLMRFVDLRKGL